MPDAPAGRPTVFLDRDGTLVVEGEGFITSPQQLQLIPGAAAGVKRLNQAGVAVALLTNQSAIARGLLDEAGLAAIHAALERALANEGARLDLIRFCPHHPEAALSRYRVECRCRKPATGMLEDAAATLGSDLARSVVVGDDLRDLALADAAAGVLRPILVRTGKGRDVEARARARFGPRLAVADDLRGAADLALARIR